jgi:hypothetical protein
MTRQQQYCTDDFRRHDRSDVVPVLGLEGIERVDVIEDLRIASRSVERSRLKRRLKPEESWRTSLTSLPANIRIGGALRQFARVLTPDECH